MACNYAQRYYILCNMWSYWQVLFILHIRSYCSFTTRLLKNKTNNLITIFMFSYLFKCVESISIGILKTLQYIIYSIHHFLLQMKACIIYLLKIPHRTTFYITILFYISVIGNTSSRVLFENFVCVHYLPKAEMENSSIGFKSKIHNVYYDDHCLL